MTEPTFSVTSLSSADFSNNVDRYISEVNTAHRVFEIAGPDEQSIMVLSKRDFESWLETIHLLSSQANAQILQESIAELERKMKVLWASKAGPVPRAIESYQPTEGLTLRVMAGLRPGHPDHLARSCIAHRDHRDKPGDDGHVSVGRYHYLPKATLRTSRS